MTNAHLMAAWARGWAVSRAAPYPVPKAGGWYIPTGLPYEAARYLLHSAADVARVTKLPIEPHTWIKVSASQDEVQAPGWTFHEPTHLMYRVPRKETCSLPPGYAAHIKEAAPREEAAHIARTDGVARAVILAADGSRAAWAQAGLTGDVAVFDRVETAPGHRRRGLGRAVMTMLAGYAGDRTGVLVATDEGRALYATLGWLYASPITALEYTP